MTPAELLRNMLADDDGHLVVLVDTRDTHRQIPMFDEPVVAVLGCHAAPREQ